MMASAAEPDKNGVSDGGQAQTGSDGGGAPAGNLSPDPVSPREPAIRAVHRSRRPSTIWLLPLLALIVGGLLLAKTLLDHGPTITVSFADAAGMEAGKTRVKFRDVEIGTVDAIHLTEDGTRVLATVSLAKEAKRFAVDGTLFWIVRPRLAGSGISGLETLMSGVYIGALPGRSHDERLEFEEAETPPASDPGAAGTRFRLQADNIGSLDVGSPVLYRRITAGHVESFKLDSDGRRITMTIFVKSPYDHFVLPNTAFWHASGIDLTMGADGVKVDTQSLATILIGGISFETPADRLGPDSAPPDTAFTLAQNKDEAFRQPDGESILATMRFGQSTRGLTLGAPVDLRGIPVGRVKSIRLERASDGYDPVVEVDIYPERIKEAGAGSLEGLVARGMRAQLRTGSLVTGQLYIGLDFFPDDKTPSTQTPGGTRAIAIATVPSDLEEITRHARSIAAKLDAVPFDAIGQDTHTALASLTTLLGHLDDTVAKTNTSLIPEIAQTTKELRTTLQALHSVTDGDGPLQQDAREAIRELSEAGRSLKTLSDGLERRPESLLRGRSGD